MLARCGTSDCSGHTFGHSPPQEVNSACVKPPGIALLTTGAHKSSSCGHAGSQTHELQYLYAPRCVTEISPHLGVTHVSCNDYVLLAKIVLLATGVCRYFSYGAFWGSNTLVEELVGTCLIMKHSMYVGSTQN